MFINTYLTHYYKNKMFISKDKLLMHRAKQEKGFSL